VSTQENVDEVREKPGSNPVERKNYAVWIGLYLGLALGGLIGFLMRPSILGAQMPLDDMIRILTEGGKPNEDPLGIGRAMAQSSLNHIVVGVIVGGVLGSVVGYVLKTLQARKG